MSRRTDQVSQELAQHAGTFLSLKSSHTSLITVTRADVSPDLRSATIYLSVLPEPQESAALDFAKRQRGPFREYLKGHARLKYVPTVDFLIDGGEKNRQRIDELTR